MLHRPEHRDRGRRHRQDRIVLGPSRGGDRDPDGARIDRRPPPVGQGAALLHGDVRFTPIRLAGRARSPRAHAGHRSFVATSPDVRQRDGARRSPPPAVAPRRAAGPAATRRGQPRPAAAPPDRPRRLPRRRAMRSQPPGAPAGPRRSAPSDPSQCSGTQPVESSPARNDGSRTTNRSNGRVVWIPPISVSSRARRRRSIAAGRSPRGP